MLENQQYDIKSLSFLKGKLTDWDEDFLLSWFKKDN